MPINRDHDLVHAHAQFLCRRLDDADIGLMWHQPIDVGFLQAIRRQRFIDNRIQRIDRHLEHGVAGHAHVAGAFLFQRHAAIDKQ